MHNSSPIHIAFSVAGKYADYVGTAIYSILKHNAESSIKFYILHQEIEAEYKRNLEQLMTHFQNATIQFVKIENQYLEKIKPAKDGLHISTYYRFLLAELLPDVNKVLYLDVDVLIRGEIRTLWNTDLSTASLGVSREIDIYAVCPEHVHSIGLEDHHNYFNAGVLLFNLQKLRSEQLDKLLLETAVSKSPELRFGDQDILNMIFKDDCVLFSYVYNFTNWRLMWPEISDQKPAIIHFSGSKWTKPWMKKEDTFDYLAPYLEDYQSYKIEYLNILQPEAKTIELFLEVHQGHHVAECIESILRQTYVHFQVSLILDKVTPETLELCSRFAEKDKRIKLLKKVKQPVFQQYGQLIEESQADYISFVREQDILEENYLTEFIQLSQEVEAPIYLSNYLIYDENSSLFYFHHPLQDHDGDLSVELTQQLIYQQENYLNHLWGKFLQREYAATQLKDYCGNLRKTSFYQDKKIGYCHQSLYTYRNENQELISIVIAAYNVEQYLEECLESVLNQTYQHIEVILVNDGSTDQTADIAEAFASRDQRLKVIHIENQGASVAKNTGIAHASGSYVVLVDSDDIISRDQVQVLYDLAKRENADITMGHYYVYDENDGRFYYYAMDHSRDYELVSPHQAVERQAYWQHYNTANYIMTFCKLIKRSLFQDVSFPVGRRFDDDACTHKLFLKANKIVHTNQHLYTYRRRRNSIMTSGFDLSWVDDLIPVYEEKLIDCLLAQVSISSVRQRYLNILNEYKYLMEQGGYQDSSQYQKVLNKLQLVSNEQ
ncbi:TPA: glycosyltransferase [Streptococcus suis]|nr:glycosyltransferase [Streptococcus suis]HEM5149903.1 glycosyltransferase [Streptococcus suis]HEM5236151.1 glycosyltransferase [Streptococcus suis]HEM5242480.1 glycosyltransferase [Streptococcus suis]